MNFISWNVNGIPAILKENFLEFIEAANPDLVCIQETKVSDDENNIDLPNQYYQYFNNTQNGVGGTAVFTKIKPLSTSFGTSEADSDEQGRIQTLEFENYYLVNVNSPAAGKELVNLDQKVFWMKQLNDYLEKLETTKPVILSGTLNVTPTSQDLAKADKRKNTAGNTEPEINQFNELINSGLTDVFREFQPNEAKYTCWKDTEMARMKNQGWRTDYFLASNQLNPELVSMRIFDTIPGSIHCPLQLTTNNLDEKG